MERVRMIFSGVSAVVRCLSNATQMPEIGRAACENSYAIAMSERRLHGPMTPVDVQAPIDMTKQFGIRDAQPWRRV